MDLGLRGRRALVTGASKGIGAAVARMLASEGCNLVLVARDLPRLEELKAEIAAADATIDVRVMEMDMRAPDACQIVAREAGPVDILINNAGDVPSGGLLEIDEERWRRFRTDLRRALEGRISLDHRISEKRTHYPPPSADVPLRVTVDNTASDFYTVVEVSAPDRIGLLHDLARAFHDLGLDVHLAVVATYGVRVVDAFYVRDLVGEKVEEPERIVAIEAAITARLGIKES
jgi:UTP:GlnB (protein PII) uridylyltransferase